MILIRGTVNLFAVAARKPRLFGLQKHHGSKPSDIVTGGLIRLLKFKRRIPIHFQLQHVYETLHQTGVHPMDKSVHAATAFLNSGRDVTLLCKTQPHALAKTLPDGQKEVAVRREGLFHGSSSTIRFSIAD